MPVNGFMAFWADRDGLSVQGNHYLLPSRPILRVRGCDVGHAPDTMDLQIAIALPADLAHAALNPLTEMLTSGEVGIRPAIGWNREPPASQGYPTKVGHPCPPVSINGADLEGVHRAIRRWPLHLVLFPQRCT